MFFSSWADIGRIVAVSAISFLLIVLILRAVGQQALSKMSGFDAVFTVTFGSVIATVVMQKHATLADGLAALLTMLALQEVIRRFQSKNVRFHHIVREVPRVVLWNGHLLEDRIEKIGLSGDEIRAAVRKAGYASLSDVRAVVLENDGDWSVIGKNENRSDESALHGLPIPESLGVANAPVDDRPARPAPKDRIP
jgi:uncharacterized membrane protein YcaP (DUF421 family)